MSNALPCIVCGKELKSASISGPYRTKFVNQPHDGVACHTYGNYGSTYFDPVVEQEVINFSVCDGCIEKAEVNGTAKRRRLNNDL